MTLMYNTASEFELDLCSPLDADCYLHLHCLQCNRLLRLIHLSLGNEALENRKKV